MKKRNEVEKKYSLPEVKAKIKRLLKNLGDNESGRIQVDGHSITIPRDADVSVAYEKSGKSHELEFQITWKK